MRSRAVVILLAVIAAVLIGVSWYAVSEWRKERTRAKIERMREDFERRNPGVR